MGRKVKHICKNGHAIIGENALHSGHSGKEYKRCKICHYADERRRGRIRRGKTLKEKKLEKLCIRIEKLTRTNSIIRQSWWDLDLKFYRASYLKEIDIGACYRAEIRASQTSNVLSETNTTLLNNDQAFGRRLSA